MNAFNNINLAASCIITSTEYAKELGIPESRWIYPLGGAGTQDSDQCRYFTFTHTLCQETSLTSTAATQSGNDQITTPAPPSPAP